MVNIQNPSSVIGNLEYREAGRTITGHFPYGPYARISNVGPVRRERFSPHAFRYTVQDPTADIQLLVGHDGNKPLASREAGNLVLEDRPEGVYFEAKLPPEHGRPTWMQDTVLAIKGGLIRGVSPGFTATAEGLETDPDFPQYQCRVIGTADLHEFSVLPNAAYKEGTLDLRTGEITMMQDEERLFGRSKSDPRHKSNASALNWQTAMVVDQARLQRLMLDQLEGREGMIDEMRMAAGHADDDDDMETRRVAQTAQAILSLAGLAADIAEAVDDSEGQRADDMSMEEREAMAWL